MEFDHYFVVFLKKGPTWTPESSPELDRLQEGHLAHLAQLAADGYLLLNGPVQDHSSGDVRGISVYDPVRCGSLDDLKKLVEADPMFGVQRLVGEYLIWYVPKGSTLGPVQP
ncbi:MAG: hypothetical protein J5I90_12075 [Caldilineales bacterium]|nr:hypothetical protein [Caldilineales bacterium]